MKKLLNFLSYVLVAAATACVTCLLMSGPWAPGQSKLDQLADLLEQRFIGDADRTVMEDAAADAMVSALGDKWSYYIPADEYQAYQEQMNNAYVGIGVTISVREDGRGFDVLKVTEGGPAKEAGIQVGDIIAKVEGQNVAELGTDGAKNMIRGKEGTQVKLTVLREEETLEISVTRRNIQVPVATAKLLPDNIGLITIENFDKRCYDETIAAIEKLRNEGAEALIFDVRFNPGGYRSELVKVLDYLLPEGDLFRSEDYTGKVEVDKSDAKYLDMPMAVMVNGSSYSAAEFFAAALREYNAAVVVGEQTCGKGYFQVTYRLNDGSAVGLSIGKYYTPNGVSLAEAGGLTPDKIIEVDDEKNYKIYNDLLDPMEDPHVLEAINALKNAK